MKKNFEEKKTGLTNTRWGDWGFVVSALLYRSMLDWAYVVLSDSYFQVQFRLNMNEVKLVISYIVVLILCLLTVRKSGSKVFFIRMLFFMTIIPNTSVYGMRDGSSVFSGWVILSFAIVEILILNIKVSWKLGGGFGSKHISRKTDMSCRKRRTNRLGMLMNTALILFSVMTVLFMYKENGMPGTVAFNLYKVYEVRDSYQASKYLNYAIALVSTVIVPFGLADGYVTGTLWKLSFYTIVQFMLYLWTGNKVFLFALIIIIGTIVITKCKLPLTLFFYGITFVVFLGNLSSVFPNRIFEFVFSLVNRRMLLDSATLKYFYYDYFVVNENPVLGFGGTVLAPILGSGVNSAYRYDLSYRYTGMVSNANTGLYGGDFANLGIFAFILVPILILVLFYLINRSEYYCGAEFSLLFFVYTVYYLNETCIFLYLFNFTGVLLTVIVMLYQYRICKKNTCRYV